MDGGQQQPMDTTSQVSEGSATTSGAQAGKNRTVCRKPQGRRGARSFSSYTDNPATHCGAPIRAGIATDKKGPIMNVLKKGSRLEA